MKTSEPRSTDRVSSAAGFRGIEIDTADKLVRFPSVADHVRIQSTATPLATVVDQHDDDRKEGGGDALALDEAEGMLR